MRIVVLGCGGIGGTLAACLTRAGADVTPVTGNPAIAQAIAERGYRVRDFEGPEWSIKPGRAPLVALDDAEARPGPFDLCIAATQSTSLAAALRSAAPHLRPGAPIVCLQNGLPEAHAAAVLGAERIVGCVVGWAASMVEPGVYQRTSAHTGLLMLGRPFASSPDPAPLEAIFGHAMPTALAAELPAVRWSKLAINCVTTTIGAVGGMRLGPLLRHRFVRRVALEVFAEVAAVARAEGVRPAPLAGTLDIEKVAISPEERLQKVGSASLAYKHSILLLVGFKYRRLRSSMLYALERGRTPEIEYLNGEVVARGRTHGVLTPVNEALVGEIRRIAQSGANEGSSLARLRAIYDAVVGTQSEARAA